MQTINFEDKLNENELYLENSNAVIQNCSRELLFDSSLARNQSTYIGYIGNTYLRIYIILYISGPLRIYSYPIHSKLSTYTFQVCNNFHLWYLLSNRKICKNQIYQKRFDYLEIATVTEF